MHEGVFFSAELTFPVGKYKDWLQSCLSDHLIFLKPPFPSFKVCDFLQDELEKNAKGQDFLNFLQQQNQKHIEFCEFEYDEKKRKFNMKAYLKDWGTFAYWIQGFGLMLSAAALIKAEGYAGFAQDVYVTDSCYYLFLAKKGKFEILFYEFDDEREKFLPFQKIWTEKLFKVIEVSYDVWRKKTKK